MSKSVVWLSVMICIDALKQAKLVAALEALGVVEDHLKTLPSEERAAATAVLQRYRKRRSVQRLDTKSYQPVGKGMERNGRK